MHEANSVDKHRDGKLTRKGAFAVPAYLDPYLDVLLFGHCISNVVEHLLDLRQGDLLWVVGKVDHFGRDINRDLTHACQFAHRSFNGMLAVFTRNVGSYQGCRFHARFPPHCEGVELCLVNFCDHQEYLLAFKAMSRYEHVMCW